MWLELIVVSGCRVESFFFSCTFTKEWEDEEVVMVSLTVRRPTHSGQNLHRLNYRL
jgi:hypothetical protein